MSTPQTKIFICSGVPLNSRYEHSIAFDSDTAQRNYFAGKVVKTLSGYSFVRKSWKLKVEGSMEQARLWNYLYFQNVDSGRYYYYFINNIEYISDSTVELTLEIDVIQTHLFNFTLNKCFVERQHTETDEIGEHTVAEGLELGELCVNGTYTVNDLEELCIMVMSTVNPESGNEVIGGNYHGVFSGLGIYAIDPESWQDFAGLLSDLGSDMDGIVNMWMYPKSLVTLADEQDWDDGEIVHNVGGIALHDVTVTKKKDLDGYEPKNNKMYCYPFNFLYLTNHRGNSAMYRYERFVNDPCEFELSGSLFPDAGVRLTPLYYNGTARNYEEGMELGGFPSCAWNADLYKIWAAQNQNSQALAGGMAALKIVGGIAAAAAAPVTGGMSAAAGVGMMASGASQIAGMLASHADMEVQPHQARGNASANINVANDMQTFMFYFKSVNAENAKIIDDYFTMYGYRINALQVPNIKARPHFTYVKTIGCHITSYLCNEDTVKIESIFDNGITFWRDGSEVGNYSLDNTP